MKLHVTAKMTRVKKMGEKEGREKGRDMKRRKEEKKVMETKIKGLKA